MPSPSPPVHLQVTPAVTLPLLQQADLVYQGGFKVPLGTDPNSFNGGGQALLYRPATDTLLAATLWQKVAEFSVPTPVIGTAAQMPRAVLVQPHTDILQGKRTTQYLGQAPVLAGMLIDPTDRLIVSAVSSYDAANAQTRSHFVTGLNFAALPPVPDPSVVWATAGQPKYTYPGFTAGHMCPIPAAYQPLLGAAFLTGQGCLSIISRTSWGPSATTFDPTLVGGAPATPIIGFRLLAYEDTAGSPGHETLGNTGGLLFNATARLGGVVWPPHTRSILFFGKNGTQPIIYGTGTATQAKAGFDANGSQVPPYTPCNGCPNPWVYDPIDGSHGYHGYPYSHFVWAYDADDFVAVKQGTKHPWEVVPYATWTFTVPAVATGAVDLKGVAYKEATKQIFLTARGGGDGSAPIVYVYQVP